MYWQDRVAADVIPALTPSAGSPSGSAVLCVGSFLRAESVPLEARFEETRTHSRDVRSRAFANSKSCTIYQIGPGRDAIRT